MSVKIPLTGTVININEEAKDEPGTHGIEGDPSDPVRPVPVDLGNVSWKLINIDLENDLMEIEIEAPKEKVTGVGKDGQPIKQNLTPDEKNTLVDKAKGFLNTHTADELYTITGSSRLVKAAGVMEKYRKDK